MNGVSARTSLIAQRHRKVALQTHSDAFAIVIRAVGTGEEASSSRMVIECLFIGSQVSDHRSALLAESALQYASALNNYFLIGRKKVIAI